MLKFLVQHCTKKLTPPWREWITDRSFEKCENEREEALVGFTSPSAAVETRRKGFFAINPLRLARRSEPSFRVPKDAFSENTARYGQFYWDSRLSTFSFECLERAVSPSCSTILEHGEAKHNLRFTRQVVEQGSDAFHVFLEGQIHSEAWKGRHIISKDTNQMDARQFSVQQRRATSKKATVIEGTGKEDSKAFQQPHWATDKPPVISVIFS